jgi:membrane-bound lytic murein transglycosylase B
MRRFISVLAIIAATTTSCQAQVPETVPGAPEADAAVRPRTYDSFETWKTDFIKVASAKGFDPAFVAQVLANVTPLDRVIAADGKQPEFSKPISSYVMNAVTPGRASAAATALSNNANISEIEAQFGVPRELLGGIWAMESDLGRVQGDIDVVSAFATLAYEGRRRDWAETQLIYVLTILKNGSVPREQLKGSWAGAMGQTQFLPDNYVRLGVDGNRDGKVDIWKTDSDALASAANLLSKGGWHPGEAWAVEVTLPAGFDYYLAETTKQTPDAWGALGVVRADGGAFNAAESLEQATLILPSGAKGPAFLALPNHFVIRKYNNSTAYALAVGLIADAIAARPAVKTPWPVETPLSMDQRIKAQTALKFLGFDPGAIDGVIGVGTRGALRNWQKAHGRPADGYLSVALADELAAMLPTSPPNPNNGVMQPIPNPVE